MEGGTQASGNRWRFAGKEEQKSGITLDWLNFGARMYDPCLGRWTTQDPLAEKYPGISPYAYCAGNPLNLVDPDGTKILIYSDTDNQYINYNSGTLFYQDGREYDGSDGLVWLTANTLNTLMSLEDEYVSAVINVLQNSDLEHRFIFNAEYRDSVEPIGEYGLSYANEGVPVGTWLKFSFNKAGFDDVYPSYETTIGHELSHSFDYDQGLQKNNLPSKYPVWKNPTEIRAVNFENRIRYRLHKPLRYKYGGFPIEKSKLEDPRIRKRL